MSGGYEIDDPRPIAAEAPYTYFLPSPQQLAALAPGDMVKLIIRADPPSEQWDAERMWVTIDSVEGDSIEGMLDNQLHDIPGLVPGDRIEFRRQQVVLIRWNEERADPPPEDTDVREYWQRCLVDACVTESGAPVHYLYREEPEPLGPEDDYPDSGWRIRGDYRDVAEEELDTCEVEFVAIGRVLNADDSWLHLIDEPIGSAFIRDWASGQFMPLD